MERKAVFFVFSASTLMLDNFVVKDVLALLISFVRTYNGILLHWIQKQNFNDNDDKEQLCIKECLRSLTSSIHSEEFSHYLSYCYSIVWDRLQNHCLSVCPLSYGHNTQPIFMKLCTVDWNGNPVRYGSRSDHSSYFSSIFTPVMHFQRQVLNTTVTRPEHSLIARRMLLGGGDTGNIEQEAHAKGC